MRDGDGVVKPFWEFPVVPEGFWNQLSENVKGLLLVDMTTTSVNVTVVDHEVRYGPDLLWGSRNILGLLVKASPWYMYELDDALYLVVNGTYYAVIPFKDFEVRWFWVVPYSVPVYAGVAVVDLDHGEVRLLSREEALRSLLTALNPLVPEDLARFYVEVLNWRGGVLNYLFYHEGMFEIKDPEGAPQPWLVRTSDGDLYWLFAVEPYGESYGVYKVFLVPARTDKPVPEVLEVSFTKPLIGPLRALRYVEQANPTVDWSLMKPTEPLPVIVNGTLYWRVPVVHGEGSGISMVCLVEASTGHVYNFKEDTALKAFIASGAAS